MTKADFQAAPLCFCGVVGGDLRMRYTLPWARCLKVSYIYLLVKSFQQNQKSEEIIILVFAENI